MKTLYHPPLTPEARALEAARAEGAAAYAAVMAAEAPTSGPVGGPAPTTSSDRTSNPLRPHLFHQVIGQEKAVRLMERVVDACIAADEPLDHTLLVGPSGTGKSTFSHVIANEMGVDVYEAEAPVSMDTLLDLREVMRHGDILRIEEIHQQAVMERRGKNSATQPEVLYALMEDRTITTGVGILPYPHITLIGTTTDEGMLPDAFLNRFALRPHLEPYDGHQMEQIARFNADVLGVTLTETAAQVFAAAARRVPRVLNNYMKNGSRLAGPGGTIDAALAHEVLFDLNGVEPDGLTRDMVNMLTFLYERCRSVNKTTDEVSYQASVNTIATAIGKSRDTKAINLRVEPWLIERGYVQVTSRGRKLTDLGIKRARQLLTGRKP